ncbi:MAG TPA: hypothetical protein VGH46_06065 [Gaiellaceae bacterium]
MAVGMLLAGEGVTEDSYRQLTEAMFGNFPMREDQAPDGALLHTAGQSEQGWYIYDVWESQEHFQRFVADKLGPAMESIGAGGGARPEPQFFPIATLVKGPAL